MAMDTTRLIHQNVYYYVVSGLTHGIQDWSSVKVVSEYPSADELNVLTLPTIAVGREVALDEDYELGTRSYEREDLFKATCFCRGDGQRDSLGEYVKNFFVEGKSKDLLDFNDGFPPAGGQTVLGKLDFRVLSMAPVFDPESPHKAEKHRMEIRIAAEFVEEI